PSAAPEAGATPWPGAYRGEDVSTYRLSGLPDRVERDPAARLTVRAQGDSALELIVVDSSNGNTICTLEATIAADRATIRPGQPCFEQQGEDTAVTASVTEGSATRSGGRLTLAATFALRLDFADTSLEGTLEYHFEGDRR
ncbi:MAG: hypothetical protein FJ104_07380, partial [Deltaproteobacteria bacterium]|nr:hypothetical protein [Deltaproteobacteria bacterium]